MKINKVKRIIREILKDYSSYDIIINDLLESRNAGIKKDVNSFIKSKNSISCATEIQAIKNINIADKIEEINKWKEIIDFVFEESKNEYSYKGKALEYKFIDNMSNGMILNILNISPSALKNWVNDFILEIAIIAIDKKVLKIDKF